MGLHGVSTAERLLQRVLVPLCVLSGVIVVSGFFFPEFVGSVVTGEVWLVVSLLFFGSGLTYLAVLPTENDPQAGESDAQYLLRVRQASVIETAGGFLSRQDPITFGVAVGSFALFFLGQLFAPAQTVRVVTRAQQFVMTDLGWLFVGAMILSVVFCLCLLVGPWGSIRLGGDGAEPAYTYPVYFTMVFTAGIAAGIVFWGPAESLFHYQTPPPLFDVDPGSDAAITAALTYALFHWGFSAWSAYLVLGIPIAYFVYQQDAPLRVSAILTPFLGADRLDSRWCQLVDLLAIFATIGGFATSVALVSEQFLTGIDFQWGVGFGTIETLLFVGGLTVIFVISAQSGVHRGIRRISAVNIVLFGLFAALFFSVAPRLFVIEQGTAAVESYARNVLPMSVQLSDGWVAEWTVWNWIWWFSWAPFAGLFLAALSHGRQLRTVVFTGFVATSLATMVWFLLLGSTSLYLQHTSAVDVLAAIDAYGGSEAVAGFPVFDALPISQLLMFLFLALIIVFMTTSADSSTLVVSVLSTRREQAPATSTIVFWGAFQGIVAVSVLLTGSVEVLQAMAVLTGGPFAIIALVAVIGLIRWFVIHERGHPSIFQAARSSLDGRDRNQ